MAVIKIHPSWWDKVQAEGNPHFSPLQNMILLLRQDDPDLCDHDAMALIAEAQRENNWGGLAVAT